MKRWTGSAALAAVVLVGAGLVPGAAAAEECAGPALLSATVDRPVVVVGPTKTRWVELRATFSDACGVVDAVGFTVTDPGFTFAFDLDLEQRAKGTVTFATELPLSAADLADAEAGAWSTRVTAYDVHDDPLFEVDGPGFSVVRDARASTNATPEPVRRGRTITVRGTLQQVRWSSQAYAGYAGQVVVLQTRTPRGRYQDLTRVTTDAQGRLTAEVPARRDTCFRYVFAGSATTEPVTSGGDCVDVR